MSAIPAASSISSPLAARATLPLIEQGLLGAVVVGAVAWWSWSALPGAAGGLGWLVALPLASLVTAFLLRLSRRRLPGASSVRGRRRRQAVSVRAASPARSVGRFQVGAVQPHVVQPHGVQPRVAHAPVMLARATPGRVAPARTAPVRAMPKALARHG